MVILDETTGKVDAKVWHGVSKGCGEVVGPLRELDVFPLRFEIIFCFMCQVLQELLSDGCTVLLVAHKLKTVENADHIIFIENGEVVEEGTHLELISRRGHYYQLTHTASNIQ